MKPPINSPWTPEKDAELIRLWTDGFSAAAIGRALGVTKGSAISRSRRLPCARRASPIKVAVPTMDNPPKPKPVAKPMPRLDTNSGYYTASKETTCRTILNDDTQNPEWCQNPRIPGKAWCLNCFGRHYIPTPPYRDRVPGWARG